MHKLTKESIFIQWYFGKDTEKTLNVVVNLKSYITNCMYIGGLKNGEQNFYPKEVR